jgi:hypothetical protein
LGREEGIWQDIVKARYLRKSEVGTVTHRDDSPVWADLLKVKNIYLQGRRVKVKNGKTTSFWTDSWREEGPLCTKYPILYELCTEKNISVNAFYEKGGAISFRRWLPAILHSQWESVCEAVLSSSLGKGGDEWIWKRGKNGIFSIKSLYDLLAGDDKVDSFSRIWTGVLQRCKFHPDWSRVYGV